MDLSLFLARFFGLYLLIVAALWLIRQEQMRDLVKELFSRPEVLAVTGAINLMLGLAVVISHPVFEWNWHGLITLLGFLAILKGVLRIGFPKQDKRMAYALVKGSNYLVSFVIMLIIGLYPFYIGFSV